MLPYVLPVGAEPQIRRQLTIDRNPVPIAQDQRTAVRPWAILQPERVSRALDHRQRVMRHRRRLSALRGMGGKP